MDKHKGPGSVGIALVLVILTWIQYSFVEQAANGSMLNQPFVARFFSTFLVAAVMSAWMLGLILWLSLLSFLRKDHFLIQFTLTVCAVLVVGIPAAKILKPFTPRPPFIEVFYSRVSASQHLDKLVLWSRETLDKWNGDTKDQTLVEYSRLPNLVYQVFDPNWSPTVHVALYLDAQNKEKVLMVYYFFSRPCGISVGPTNYVMLSAEAVHIQKVRDGVYVFETRMRE